MITTFNIFMWNDKLIRVVLANNSSQVFQNHQNASTLGYQCWHNFIIDCRTYLSAKILSSSTCDVHQTLTKRACQHIAIRNVRSSLYNVWRIGLRGV